MRMPANANAVAVAVTVAPDNRPAAATATASPETASAAAPASASASETRRLASAASAAVAAALPPPLPVPSMPLTLSRSSRHDAALAAGRLEPYSFAAHHPPPPPLPTYYRRLAAAPGPAPGPGPASAPTPAPAAPAAPPTSAARHGAFGFPPSPSPTPSHPNSFNSLSSHDRNHSSSSFTSTGNNHVTSAPRSDTSKPGRCSVMALQNVLCDPDDDVDMTSSRSSHPPTPPHLDALNPPVTHSAPVSPASAPLETSAFVARPNPSHVVMTTRPQLHTPHIQHTEPGCKTCQIRKMPCDEGRPSCQNCSRMGIHCLGYFSPSHANAQQVSDRSVPSVSANAKRQDQEEYLFFLLDHYRHTKRHCMWELITLDFNEHFSCNMRKEALQMIKRRRFKDKDTREASPNDASSSSQRPKARRGRRPRSNAPSLQLMPQEADNESGTG
ncbi:C6 finger domain-containing protein [Colletotrichum tofieldiae]|nr:C6 finger domain-containing protein [Colletotrichum tofieldiae]GKT75165.1 C6 finger domain-containing protein [Colletotrichum tofieldiae]GKT92404.1 C6 finger domain-containing protein [Colletotrichum tofieldiae]